MAEQIKDQELDGIEEESEDGLILDESEIEEELANNIQNEEETSSDSEETATEATESKEKVVSSEPEHGDSEDHSVQKKQSKLQKILIIVIGVLSATLLFGFILYLFGVFDPEPPKPVELPPVVEGAQPGAINQPIKPEKYIFDSKDINVDRLNGKLRILTKYEIIGTEEEERQKELEKNSKLSTEQINNLIEAEKKKEEEDKLKKEAEEKKALEDKLKKEAEEKKALEDKLKKEAEEKLKTENPYTPLKFIQITANEDQLSKIKTDLDKLKVTISKCQDNVQSFTLIGPFESNKDLNNIYKTIYTDITQSATKKDLARLEFNRICK